MIVATMTLDQIYEEIMADIPNMTVFLGHKGSKFRQMVLRSQLLPVHAYSLITTKRKNNWLLLWYAESKKDISGHIYASCLCLQNTHAGKYALMRQVIGDAASLAIYSPHFFQRYAQRMNLDLSGIDLIRKYFEENRTFFIKEKTIAGEQAVTITSKDGVAFGLRREDSKKRCYIIRTFISYDMGKSDQIEGFSESEMSRLIENARFTEEIAKNRNRLLLDSVLD